MENQQQDNTNQMKQDLVKDDKNDAADTSAIYFGDSKMQTKAKFDQNKKTDHTEEDNTFTSFAVEDTESDVAKAAGTDRAGTAERKTFGDTELNKGLEAQAKDEEL